jgi:chaperonin GroEL
VSKLVKDVVFGDDLHSKIASGFKKVYNVAKESYGPNAGNALIEYPYGDPLISRDGVTNVNKLILEDGIENATVQIARQASAHSDQTVGDGTTGAIILAYHLYTAGRKLIAAGENQMVVSRRITAAADEAVKQVDKMKTPLTTRSGKIDLELLEHVSQTSAGDEAIGAMVADTINTIGADGGVTIEDFAGRGVFNEIVEGFYFRKGLVSAYLAKDPANLESKHYKAPILILDKQLSAQNEAADLLEKIVAKFKELVIIGSVTGDALAFIVQMRLSNKILVSIVDPPYDARSLFLEDLALMTGATVVTEGFDTDEFNLNMLGFAEKAVITTQGTTLLGSDGEQEKVEERAAELRKQLEETTNPYDIEMIRARISRLTGKVAIIRVGGAIETEQKEVKLRVQDAVGAAQAALKDGILPGGGTTLARLDVPFKDAFEAPFKQLAQNSGVNAERLLFQLQESRPGYGFDLKNVSEKPVDLIKAGVVDPSLVVKEIILNAASVASKLLTTSSGITLVNREEKHD